MSDSQIYRSGRAADLAASYRAKLSHYEAVLEGREAPALVDERYYESYGEMLGFPRGTDHRLVKRYLRGDLGEIGTEIRDLHDERHQAKLTKRRQLQRIRHEGARRKGQPSPLAVLRFVVEYEERKAEQRGAAAAAAKHFGKSRSRISRLLVVADDYRQELEGARAYFKFRIDFGLGDQNERQALPAILATTEQLLRKLPPCR